MTKRNSFFKLALSAIFISILAIFIQAVNVDNKRLDYIGKSVAFFLHHNHYGLANKKIVEERLFDNYIDELDPLKNIFYQADVVELRKMYENKLYPQIIKGGYLKSLIKINQLYQKRLVNHLNFAIDYLQKGQFKFDKKRTIRNEIKNKKWPKDRQQMAEDWRNVISAEYLHNLLIIKSDTENKKTPAQQRHDIIKKILKKLKYRLSEAEKKSNDVAEINNQFLNTLARSYDTHSSYLSHKEQQKFVSRFENNLIGIGAYLSQDKKDGTIVIKGIVKGTPAEKSRQLKLNDKIVAVDSNNTGNFVDISFLPLDKIVDMIQGKANTVVRMRVLSSHSKKYKVVKIRRQKIQIKDSYAKGIIYSDAKTKQKIGLIQLPSFYDNFSGKATSKRCSHHVKEILQLFNQQKVTGVVLDLRNNGGGSLREAVAIAGFFLGGDKPIVQLRGKKMRQTLLPENKEALYKGPLVVLQNRLSASASEIVAAALQDYQRAVILGGESSHGKGTVQTIRSIDRFMNYFYKSKQPAAGSVKVTFQKFYRPNGGATQFKGVTSDIKVPAVYDVLTKGEQEKKMALPYNEIPAVSQYQTATEKQQKQLDALKTRSQNRIKKSAYFNLIKNDMQRIQEIEKKSTVSLHLATREQDYQQREKENKQIEQQQKQLIKQWEKQNLPYITAQQVNLDQHKLIKIKPYQGESYLIKDDKEAIIWPYSLDPLIQEAIMIIQDIVKMEHS